VLELQMCTTKPDFFSLFFFFWDRVSLLIMNMWYDYTALPLWTWTWILALWSMKHEQFQATFRRKCLSTGVRVLCSFPW
jgi:hypothetical protein